VLAAGPETLLSRCCSFIGTLLVTKKNRFELYHPGVREEKCGIFCRDKGRTRDDLMSFLPEKFKKQLAYLVALHGFSEKYFRYGMVKDIRIISELQGKNSRTVGLGHPRPEQR
jgi:hypothetical protein